MTTSKPCRTSLSLVNQPITKVDWPTWPQFGEEEAAAVADVVRSQQLFAATHVRKFEQDFAQFLGSKRAVGIGNATQGLHLALAALNVGEGDEVITTPCSWISSSSCILMQNAVPVFIDIESESLGMDPALIERAITPLTKAILPVHILGYPARIPEICEVAKAAICAVSMAITLLTLKDARSPVSKARTCASVRALTCAAPNTAICAVLRLTICALANAEILPIARLRT
ncbi:MAG: hypothetical protein EBV41_04065, partial [Actinobacteria bacterium]|nr:hypothetical protein [Actinomycetota bacterium]